MAHCLALFFATLIAVSQAAPRPQNGNNSNQQAGTIPGSSLPGDAANSPQSNTATVSDGSGVIPAGSIAVIMPQQVYERLFPSTNAGGNSNMGTSGASVTSGTTGTSGTSSTTGTSGTSGTNGVSVSSPLAAIISLIPNVIDTERARFGNAVKDLVSGNVGPITDSIEQAATTGGRLLSNGFRLAGAWPTFFGQLIG